MSKKRYTSLKAIRKKAYKLQSGLCYYCSQPMWEEKEKQSFITQYRLKPTIANFLQCTAEHLLARQDGGNNSLKNIVAACKYCNHTRHKSKNALSPERYKLKVQKRLSNNGWHRIAINPMQLSQART